MFQSHTHNEAEVVALLRRKGINPTQQRIAVTRTILTSGKHVAADQVFRIVNRDIPKVSKATVYNTLGLLAKKGIIREVIADPSRVFYDPNTSPHQHIYDEDSGELVDVDAKEVVVTKLPVLPENAELRGVDVIIRIRNKAKA
jgi:Fur family iron response transcriptional regulator